MQSSGQWHCGAGRAPFHLLIMAGLELLGKGLVQTQHRLISDHHIPESADTSVSSIGYSDLVEAALNEVVEVLCE